MSSDDEFSDFSEDEKKVVKEELVAKNEETPTPAENLDDSLVHEDQDDEDYESETDKIEISFPLNWDEYKKIESDILKYVLLHCWVEEKFVVRASIKNLIYNENEQFEFKTKSYDIKDYNEKTYDITAKLCLLYTIFNFLEKCPY